MRLHVGMEDSEYLPLLSRNLEEALQEFTPDIIIYNAGTDCLRGDPLGLLSISPKACLPVCFKLTCIFCGFHCHVTSLLCKQFEINVYVISVNSLLRPKTLLKFYLTNSS